MAYLCTTTHDTYLFPAQRWTTLRSPTICPVSESGTSRATSLKCCLRRGQTKKQGTTEHTLIHNLNRKEDSKGSDSDGHTNTPHTQGLQRFPWVLSGNRLQ